MMSKERLQVAKVIDEDAHRTSLKTHATRRIAERLLVVMRDHIGRSKGVSKVALYRAVFGEKYVEDDLGAYMRWEFVCKAMQMLRKRSNCFVMSEHSMGRHIYFVVRSERDAQSYADGVSRKMREMRKMQAKALRAAKGRWHEKEWLIEGRGSSKAV